MEINSNKIEKLFFEVYRNFYLKDIIFNHLRIYNENTNRIFKNCEKLRQYSQKHYIIKDDSESIDLYDNFSILSLLDIECLTLNNNYSHSIESYDLPKSLKKIKFGNNWNHGINLKNTNIETIIFANNYNKKLKAGDLPDSLKEIVFGYYYSQCLEIGSISSQVEKITFGNNPLVVGIIPSSCKILKLGELLIGSIPPNVTYLSFGNSFTNNNCKIKAGILPSSLTHLIFGDSNIELLKGSIPDSVKYLYFGSKFTNNNKSFKNVLPNNLLHLEFKNINFQFPIYEKPPNSILKNNYIPLIPKRKTTFSEILGNSILLIFYITRAIYESITGITD
ncbi:hypothetical protein DDB_G0282511 [Dictyostelium discoideum AX4]|uniref:FNIP repeat-containing protein n=1 Tax=Dictyostelium discoideum TaxID=44689 RepID=Q54SE5_DICDI|nr:hypothetical protein DDB_G0282511 [Dictyostelium discoideum AX4]EAL66115.1 hypothetical protein DDB_G0282511 [Dictyostelium discoideum AX4]|eukprot:XP_640094.1 hypothetical protein DDB_G0282511 [Dictyostelium discoideum AX4]